MFEGENKFGIWVPQISPELVIKKAPNYVRIFCLLHKVQISEEADIKKVLWLSVDSYRADL